MFILDDNGNPREEQPTSAYSQKAKCLKHYRADMGNGKIPETYAELKPILKDILRLHDHILFHAKDRYNDLGGGRKAGGLAFMQKRKRATKLTFMGQEVEHRMDNGALYPILGAFRYLVEKKDDGKVGWKLGKFENVVEFCNEILGEMVDLTKSGLNNKSIDAAGKDSNHWTNLYRLVENKYLHKRTQSLTEQLKQLRATR